MKKIISLVILILGLALIAASGNAFARSDSGEEHAQEEGQCRHQHHHHQHCKCHNDHDRASFDREDHHHNFGPHERFSELTAKLNLSDQQKAQMKETFKKNQPAVKPIFTKLINEKRTLRDLIQSGTASEAAIRAQASKVASVEADMAVQHAQMAKQFHAILTPEQIEKFKAAQKEKDSKFDKFREHMGERFEGHDAEK